MTGSGLSLTLAFVATALLVIPGCAVLTPAPSQPPGEYKNLEVLKPSSREELIATMKGFTRALGVRCTECHEQAPGADHPDFASDAKPEKEVARTMILMTRDINARYISKLPEQEATVSCMTCHRGHAIPDISKDIAAPGPAASERPGE